MAKRNIVKVSVRATFVLVAAAFTAAPALAVTYTWKKPASGSNNNWDNVNNWLRDDQTAQAAPPVDPTTQINDLIFAGSVDNPSGSTVTPRKTIGTNTDATYTVRSMAFQGNATPGLTSITVGGTSTTPSTKLTIGNPNDANDPLAGIYAYDSGYTVNLNSASAANLFKVVLASNQTWNVAMPILDSNTRTLTVNTTVEGPYRITKTGQGFLVFSRPSPDWSGGVNLSEGNIRVGGSLQGAFLGTGTITVDTANNVGLYSSDVGGTGGDKTLPNNLVLKGSGRLSFSGSYGFSLGAGSTVTLQSDKVISTSRVTNFDGPVVESGGSFGITKTGGGYLKLNAANTFTGAVSVGIAGQAGNHGGLAISHPQSLGTAGNAVNVYAGGMLELSGGLAIPGGKPLSIQGTGAAVPAEGETVVVTPNLGAVRNVSGDSTWAGSVSVLGGGATVNVEAGSLVVSGAVTDASGDGTGVLTKAGAGTLSFQTISGPGLVVGAGTVRLTGDGSDAVASRVKALSVAPGATLDVVHNDVIVDYDGASPFGEIYAAVKASYAKGAWTGGGAITASAAALPAAQRAAALAVVDNAVAQLGGMDGQTVDTSAVLLKYTVYGDVDLDGDVDQADVARVGLAGADWSHGDFNFDGAVTGDDWALLSLGGALQATAAAGAAVPEPGAAGAVAVLAVAGVVRRRRTHR